MPAILTPTVAEAGAEEHSVQRRDLHACNADTGAGGILNGHVHVHVFGFSPNFGPTLRLALTHTG